MDCNKQTQQCKKKKKSFPQTKSQKKMLSFSPHTIFGRVGFETQIPLKPPPYYQRALIHLHLTLMIGQGRAALI